MWRINRERIVLLAGPAAAVLQVAHPQVAMGVAAHSMFRTDPMRRLRRTLDAVYSVAFGTREEVEGVRAGVARAHRAVRGPGYSAFDPGAQMWVLATLVMGSVTMYERFVGRISLADRNRFLEENGRFGEVFGLDPALVPTTWERFERYWQEMVTGPILGSHTLCAEVARAVICPDGPWFLRPLSPLVRALTVEGLPEAVCRRLQIAPGPLSRSLWPVLDRLLPPLLPRAPSGLRYAAQYLRAARRENARP